MLSMYSIYSTPYKREDGDRSTAVAKLPVGELRFDAQRASSANIPMLSTRHVRRRTRARSIPRIAEKLTGTFKVTA